MSEDRTTAAVQRYLNALDNEDNREANIRVLLDRAVQRLQLLCTNLLHRTYPRLAQPPLNLQSDELLSAVVERLLKAMRKVQPQGVRQFFALATQHMRWELNDLARRLDEQRPAVALPDGDENQDQPAAPPASSDSSLSANSRRMLEAIDKLPDDQREVFDLVRIQGLSQVEVAEMLEIAPKTVQRRLNRALYFLADCLQDLEPP